MIARTLTPALFRPRIAARVRLHAPAYARIAGESVLNLTVPQIRAETINVPCSLLELEEISRRQFRVFAGVKCDAEKMVAWVATRVAIVACSGGEGWVFYRVEGR